MKNKPQIAKKVASLKKEKRAIQRRPKPGFERPDFDSLFQASLDENPLDELGDYPTLEEDAAIEVDTIYKTVIDARRQQRDRFRIANDTKFYLVVCFQTEAQKLKFLRAMDWSGRRNCFLNGLEVATSLGVDIEHIDLPMRESKRQKPKFTKEQEVIV